MRHTPMRHTSLILLTLLITTALSPLSAATINVPAQVPTIQGAIAAALPGDVIEVSPGTYNEHLDFLGKAITVRGAGGAAVTFIDGGNTDTVVSFVNGEGPDSVLEAFTIRNGHAPGFNGQEGGGGIFVENASPTVRGNIIRDNSAHWNGAGMYLVNSTALVVDNQFIDNTFSPIIADAPFGRGAGVHISGGAPTILRNSFTGNAGADQGGGIYCCDAQAANLDHNQVIGNVSGFGGGIAIDGNSLVFATNNLIVGNQAIGHTSLIGHGEGFGGGVYIAGPSSAGFTNATILANSALSGWNGPGTGGGVYANTLVALPPSFQNSVIRDNVAMLDAQTSGFLILVYSNVQGGTGGTLFDADPLYLVGPDGDYYLSQVATGQAVDSPNVDAGDPMAALLGGTTTRIDQIPDTGIIDVGFQFPAPAGAQFVRGDCNVDGAENLADAVWLLTSLFPQMPVPPLACEDACDGNDDGSINISDAVTILNALFGSPATPLPAPIGSCGSDPTLDTLSCGSNPSC